MRPIISIVPNHAWTKPFRIQLANELRLISANAERFGLSHQLSQRLSAHFSGDTATVDLHRDLGKIELGGNLLAHEAGRN